MGHGRAVTRHDPRDIYLVKTSRLAECRQVSAQRAVLFDKVLRLTSHALPVLLPPRATETARR